MRPDQITKLAEIEERLVDVFSEECSPEDWPGMEKKEDRGDRYWHKKNALATLTIVGRIQTVLRDLRSAETGDGKAGADGPQAPAPRDESIEEEAERLEKLGAVILKKRAKKAR